MTDYLHDLRRGVRGFRSLYSSTRDCCWYRGVVGGGEGSDFALGLSKVGGGEGGGEMAGSSSGVSGNVVGSESRQLQVDPKIRTVRVVKHRNHQNVFPYSSERAYIYHPWTLHRRIVLRPTERRRSYRTRNHLHFDRKMKEAQ